MPRILLAGRMHPSGPALIEAAEGFSFDYVEEGTEAAYLPFIEQADAIVIRTQPLRAETIARAERLRIVSRHGVGYDSVDVAALDARGIPLAIAGDANALSVAEHAMTMILALAKQLRSADASTRDGSWHAGITLPREVAGKRLLIVGFGRTGRRLAAFASAFGMAVDVHDPFAADLGGAPVRPVADLKAALAQADFVSLHAPKAEAPLIGAEEFAAMKPGAVLVNTARGGVVDEAALLQALEAGRLAGAGLDVFETEPLPKDHPLARSERVLLTPHLAGVTEEAAERMARISVQNVLDFFAGCLDPAMVVNPSALSRAEA